MDTSTKLLTDLTADTPVELGAELRVAADVRRKIDNQILAIQQHLLNSVLSGVNETWAYLSGSSTSVTAQDCVCLSGEDAVEGIPVVTKAVEAALSDAKSVCGIVRFAAAPNTRVRVAIGGMLGPEDTGLEAGSSGAVRCNITTARCEVVGSMGATDYPVGTVDLGGSLTIATGPTPTVAGFTGGGGGVTYTLSGASANLVTEDWVCLAAAGSDVITKATPAAVLAAGGVLGVVTGPYTAGASGVVVYTAGATGELPISLGAGDAAIIALNSSARAYRVDVESGGEQRLGTVATDGSVTVNPRPAVVTSPLHTYNPQNYGCPWDGIHDDTPGWNAMMAAIPKTSSARIDLPPGMGYFANDCKIKRYVHIHGRGGGSGQDPNSGIRLAPLRKIDFQGALLSDDGGISQGSHFEFVDVFTKAVIVGSNFAGATYHTLGVDIDVRVAGTFVEIGTCVLRAGATVGANGTQTQTGSGTRNAVMFRCSVAGTPTGADPAAFATKTVANIGDTITDTGGVSWIVEGIPKDLQASHAYGVGERWYCPGDNRFIYECTIAGTTDTAPNQAASTNYLQPELGKTFVDGTVTCRVLIASSILVASGGIHVRHCNFFGGFGFAVHLESGQYDDARYIFADFCDVHDLNVFYAGGGVALHGGDTNGGSTRDVRFFGCSLQQRTSKDSRLGTGEFCVWDRSQGGNSHYSNYSQFGKAPAYVCDSASFSPVGNVSIFEHCHSENVLGDLLYAPCIKIGTGISSEQDESSCMLLTYSRTRNLAANETASAKKTTYTMQALLGSASVASSCIQAGDDAGASNHTAWWTDKINVTSIGTGWLCRGVGPSIGGGTRAIYGTSYYDCKNAASGPGPGIGLFRIYDGVFGGRDITTAPYEGLDVAMLTNSTLRYGLRKVGDRFLIPSATHAKGTWRKAVCTTQGYRAPRWTAGTVYLAELGSPYFVEAVRVEPTTQALVYSDGAGKVWEYVSGPANTGVEPVWTSISIGSTFVDAGGTTWKYIGLTAVFEADDFVDDHVTGLTPQAKISWEDTAATDSVTAAPKTAVPGQRFDGSTSATTANQVLASFTLVNNTVNTVDVVIEGKIAATANATIAKLSGSFVVNGSTITRLGTDDAPTPKDNGTLAGSTFNLNINGLVIEVRVTPAVATLTGWGVVIQDVKRKD